VTKNELYKRAQEMNVKGRSRMDKGQLEHALGLSEVKGILVDTILTERIKSRIPERTAFITGQGRNGQESSPDGKVVTLATLLAVCSEGVDKLNKYSRPGKKLPECSPMFQYGIDGRRLDPCYPLDGDPTPMVGDKLVSAGELLDAGYTFTMSETRFRGSSESDLLKLSQSDTIPPEYHGEATTVGAMGENRYASIQEMLTDSLAPYEPGNYCVEIDIVTLENIQKAMCDLTLPVKGYRPRARLNAAKRRAILWTWAEIEGNAYVVQLDKGDNCAHVMGYIRHLLSNAGINPNVHNVNQEHDVKTLVLERKVSIEDRAFQNDLLDRNALDFMDFQDFMKQWDRSTYEIAREEMKSFRMHVVNKQRDNFLRVLNWIFSSTVKNVQSAFSYPNGSFHKGKNDRDTEGDPKLTPNQKVLLDMAAAIRTGRTIKEGQKALYENVAYSSPWEIWQVTGEREPTWNEEIDQDNPF